MKILKLILSLGIALCICACGNSGSGETSDVAQQPSTEPPARSSCELTMGWDPWEPYQYEIAGGQVLGLDVDLMTATLRNAGCDIAFHKGTWRELLQQLKDGEIDLLSGATRTADREQFAFFTDPYRDEQFSLFIASDHLTDFADKPFQQLLQEGLKFGVVEDYLYGDPVSTFQDDEKYENQFEYSALAEINVSLLLDGGVDGIIEDTYVGASIMRHKNLYDFIALHPLRLNSNPVSIMVSRASVDEALFAKINQSVLELRQNGAIDKVLAQYVTP